MNTTITNAARSLYLYVLYAIKETMELSIMMMMALLSKNISFCFTKRESNLYREESEKHFYTLLLIIAIEAWSSLLYLYCFRLSIEWRLMIDWIVIITRLYCTVQWLKWQIFQAFCCTVNFNGIYFKKLIKCIRIGHLH